jgi:hypothetical protein
MKSTQKEIDDAILWLKKTFDPDGWPESYVILDAYHSEVELSASQQFLIHTYLIDLAKNKARADLFERQYEELKKWWNIDTTKIVLNDLLTRHESERQVFKDTH